MHETTLILSYGSVEIARILKRSLGQEAGEISGDRTRTTLSRDGETIRLTIEAEDLVSLRAGHNTWLGLATVAEESIEVTSDGSASVS